MARYEYNSTLNELDVTPGQAYQYEEMLDKAAAARAVQQGVKVINSAFAISTASRKFTVMKWDEETQRWVYVLSTFQTYYERTQETFTHLGYVEFETEDEALAFIDGMVKCFEWMSGLSAAHQWVQEVVMNEVIAFHADYVGLVVYYVDKSDNSDRVARLLEINGTEYKLADPADKHDYDWYPFQRIENIKLGAQHCEGWY